MRAARCQVRDALYLGGRRRLSDLAGPAHDGQRHDDLPRSGRAHLSVPGVATDQAGNHELPPATANVPQDTTTVNLGPCRRSRTRPRPTSVSRRPRSSSHRPIRCSPRRSRRSRPRRHPAIPPSLRRSSSRSRRSRSRPGSTRATASSGRWRWSWPPTARSSSAAALRNELFRIPANGGPASTPNATLPYQIFAMAFDSQGHLWATTGGGPLLSSIRTPAPSSTSSATALPWRSPFPSRPTRSTCPRRKVSRSSTRRTTPSRSTAAIRTCGCRAWRSARRQSLGSHMADARQVVEFDDHARAR